MTRNIRMLLWIVGFILTPLYVENVTAQDETAELFKRMEQQILSCKTLQLEFEIINSTRVDDAVAPADSVKGRLDLAQGNKMRLQFESTHELETGVITEKTLVISDGARMRTTVDGTPNDDLIPSKQLTDVKLAAVTRLGLQFELTGPDSATNAINLLQQYTVSDFRLGKKETVSGKETQAVDYKVNTKDARKPAVVTVWIDVKTNLPVKRVLVRQSEGWGIQRLQTVTESYKSILLDGKIDKGQFVLPK